MKKISFLTMLIMVIVFACNKDEAIIQTADIPELLTLQEIEKLGVEHNNALDQVLIGLKEKKVSYKNDKDNIEVLINNELNKFYKTNLGSEKEIDCAIKQSEKEIARLVSRANNASLKNSQSPLQIIMEEYSENITESQRNFLIQIDEALCLSDNNVEVIISKLNSIQEIAQNELSAEEAQVILAGTEIGKASIQYWSENIEEWKQVLGAGGTKWFNWSELGGSDVAGAIGGAVYAGIMNVIPGAGQVAYGATILATGAGASATDAVIQIWGYYF